MAGQLSPAQLDGGNGLQMRSREKNRKQDQVRQEERKKRKTTKEQGRTEMTRGQWMMIRCAPQLLEREKGEREKKNNQKTGLYVL